MSGSGASSADPGRLPRELAELRTAVRRFLRADGMGAEGNNQTDGELVVVACSGGPDSLALAAAAAYVVPRLGGRVAAVVVDHGLQQDSSAVADDAARACRRLGIDTVAVCEVEPTGSAGPEGNARDARYAALRQVADQWGARRVLLGHTRDDQAETVLLGLARGSGARSLAGMAPRADVFGRPLLEIGRDVTHAACEQLGLRPWRDPHNSDPAYARSRVRTEALPVLEATIGPGVAAALARTASQLSDDAAVLDELAAAAIESLLDLTVDEGTAVYSLDTEALTTLARALRTRVLRAVALRTGSPADELTYAHVRGVDALLTDWHGQGPLMLPGRVSVARRAGRLEFRRP